VFGFSRFGGFFGEIGRKLELEVVGFSGFTTKTERISAGGCWFFATYEKRGGFFYRWSVVSCVDAMAAKAGER
jgi:hypothetical protein